MINVFHFPEIFLRKYVKIALFFGYAHANIWFGAPVVWFGLILDCFERFDHVSGLSVFHSILPFLSEFSQQNQNKPV